MNVTTMSKRIAATGAVAALAAAGLVGAGTTAAQAAPVTNVYTCTTPAGPADVTLDSDAPGIEGFDGFLNAGVAAPGGALLVTNKFTITNSFHDTLVSFGIENLAFPDFAGGFGNSSVPVEGVAVTVSGMVDNGNGTWSTDTSDANADGLPDEGAGLNGAFEAPSGGDHDVLAPGAFTIRADLNGTPVDVPCTVQGAPQSYATLTVNKNASTTTGKALRTPLSHTRATKLKAKVTAANHTPTGKVIVKQGAKKLGSAKLNDNGVAKVNLGKLSKGKHKVIVSYKGDGYTKTSKSAPIVLRVK